MSMYRQLWLAIILSTLLALLGSLLAATLSARSYLSEQLTMKNADNAAALALSLSQQNPDAVAVELAVAALFDSGHYERIRVTDPFGKIIVERQSPVGRYAVPVWFANTFPIESSPGTAQISNGWKQFGVVELVSHGRFAYQALWKSVWEMVVALAAAGLVGGALGSQVLRRLRKPLTAVINQAQAITERRFVTIEEPQVPELKQLAAAMNTTVTRLKTMFDDEATRLEVVRREVNCDPLTGLANRNSFLAQLRADLAEEESQGGALLLVRIANLVDINRANGREATDELLRRVGSVVEATAAANPSGVGARLNGADYALLLPGESDSASIAAKLLQTLIQEGESFVGAKPIAQIGFGRYPRGLDASAAMAQVDTALAAAEAEGRNTIHEAVFAADDEAPRSGEEWTHLIRNALDRRWVRLISFPVARLDGDLIHRECPLRLMLDEHGEWLPAGRFLPMAERLRLTPQIDLTAVALGLEQLATDPGIPGLAINLSASSIQDEQFRRELLDRLHRHPEAAKRLWLEVAETGALNHFNAFRSIVGALKGTGVRLGIEHFGRHFSQIGLLHDLGLDYIKVDAAFIRGLDGDGSNRTFLQGLSIIAHGIGLTVIAEGVVSEAELLALSSVGFDGATGPAIKDVSG
ncbi:MAG: EAL domain-containing protein [Gammaproteobacteria bacterium]|nr:EAL domain-containing protein [Gammaproteobacteria bacterium]MBU1415399.1 EAL domain-containing protein [Gammaproteobacteria bacterium]